MSDQNTRSGLITLTCLLCFVFARGACSEDTEGQEQPLWRRHTIDQSSRGADGVRLGDVNDDGRIDIATGWEEGGRIRVAFGPSGDWTKPWPSVTVGRVRSPEDAFICDVNADGWPDVISCCEGAEQTVFLHRNPGSTASVADPDAWTTVPVTSTQKVSRWMFAEQLDSQRVVLGSKNPAGQIALLSDATADASLQTIRTAGWIMSLRVLDMDADGDADILYSDRKGARSGVGWLEQTDDGEWKDRLIAGGGQEVMFLDVMTRGNRRYIACNTRNEQILLLGGTLQADRWDVRRIAHPPNSGAGKAVAFGDVNGDGQPDLVCTCGLAKGRHGAYWLQGPVVRSIEGRPSSGSRHEALAGSPAVNPERWEMHPVSGRQIGEKFDRIELRDIDQDGDLDLVTCEERDNLGVFWYENPSLRR